MRDLEREVLEYMKERNWHRVRPSDVAKSVVVEAAELLEIFQWTDLTIAQTKKDGEKIKKIKLELADVLIYCIEMSALLGFDTKEIIREKLALARKKYPAELMRKSSNRKRPGSDRLYLKIKEKHRRRER